MQSEPQGSHGPFPIGKGSAVHAMGTGAGTGTSASDGHSPAETNQAACPVAPLVAVLAARPPEVNARPSQNAALSRLVYRSARLFLARFREARSARGVSADARVRLREVLEAVRRAVHDTSHQHRLAAVATWVMENRRSHLEQQREVLDHAGHGSGEATTAHQEGGAIACTQPVDASAGGVDGAVAFLEQEAHRLLGGGSSSRIVRICILGGAEVRGSETHELVKKLAQELSAALADRAAFLTGGVPGVPRLFAEHCCPGARLWNVVPVGQASGFRAGTDLEVGANAEQRKAIFARLGDVCLVVGGGPAVAQEARAAHANGCHLVPLARAGGTGAGRFGFPMEALRRPAWATELEWPLLGATDVPLEQTVGAAVDILDRLTYAIAAGKVSELEQPSGDEPTVAPFRGTRIAAPLLTPLELGNALERLRDLCSRQLLDLEGLRGTVEEQERTMRALLHSLHGDLQGVLHAFQREEGKPGVAASVAAAAAVLEELARVLGGRRAVPATLSRGENHTSGGSTSRCADRDSRGHKEAQLAPSALAEDVERLLSLWLSAMSGSLSSEAVEEIKALQRAPKEEEATQKELEPMCEEGQEQRSEEARAGESHGPGSEGGDGREAPGAPPELAAERPRAAAPEAPAAEEEPPGGAKSRERPGEAPQAPPAEAPEPEGKAAAGEAAAEVPARPKKERSVGNSPQSRRYRPTSASPGPLAPPSVPATCPAVADAALAEPWWCQARAHYEGRLRQTATPQATTDALLGAPIQQEPCTMNEAHPCQEAQPWAGPTPVRGAIEAILLDRHWRKLPCKDAEDRRAVNTSRGPSPDLMMAWDCQSSVPAKTPNESGTMARRRSDPVVATVPRKHEEAGRFSPSCSRDAPARGPGALPPLPRSCTPASSSRPRSDPPAPAAAVTATPRGVLPIAPRGSGRRIAPPSGLPAVLPGVSGILPGALPGVLPGVATGNAKGGPGPSADRQSLASAGA